MPESARVTDNHTCPTHTGGPIIKGSPDTVVTAKAAARLIDLSQCIGLTDPIAQGSSTVLMDGLPASRKTDKTSHQGAIVTGEATVVVGGDPIRIAVDGDEAFAAKLQAALAKILPTRSGQEWMRQMAANKHG